MFKQLLYRAVNQAPKLLRFPIQKAPFEWYCRPLQLALQQLLKEQIEEGELDFLEDKQLQVDVTDLGLKFVISIVDEELILLHANESADVTFTGESPDLLLVAARRQDPDTLFFRRKLSIEGDTELGLAAKNMLDSVDWEQLPKLLMLMLDKTASIVEQAQQSELQQSATAQSVNA